MRFFLDENWLFFFLSIRDYKHIPLHISSLYKQQDHAKKFKNTVSIFFKVPKNRKSHALRKGLISFAASAKHGGENKKKGLHRKLPGCE